jgi:hypothetical protein
MNVLKQYQLTNRPVVRSSAAVQAKEGVVVNFVRKLPSEVLKKPRNVVGYDKMIREREAEFEPELPVEGADASGADAKEAEVAEAAASGADAKEAEVAEAAASAGVFVVDKRHTVDFDRDAIMAKIRGSSRTAAGVIPLQPQSFSNSFVASDESVREPADSEVAEGDATAPVVVKLQKRAILPSDEVVKQTKASAALAIAEANEPADYDEMRMPLPEDAAATDATDAPAVADVEAVVPKKRVIRPKPKGAAAAAASGSVSAATVSVKAVVKKIKERDDSMVNISAYKVGDTIVSTRLPAPRPLPQVQASEFYMNNRAKFIQYINALFRPYRDELTSGENDISCESLYGGDDSASVALLTHQKIVRDYLNIYSPYRGLLLFHGLGSGKTCSSIAIAEGLKTFKRIIVMTPASLRMNYIEEMKSKCGDLMYKKNQYWEFIESRGNPELTRVYRKS